MSKRAGAAVLVVAVVTLLVWWVVETSGTRVDGRISDWSDKPFAGAQIAIHAFDDEREENVTPLGPVLAEATTDDEGRFTVRGLPVGRYDVSVLLPSGTWDHEADFFTFRENGDSAVELETTLVRPIVERIVADGDGLAVKGRVIWKSGENVNNFEIVLLDEENSFTYRIKGTKGHYETRLPREGEYVIDTATVDGAPIEPFVDNGEYDIGGRRLDFAFGLLMVSDDGEVDHDIVLIEPD